MGIRECSIGNAKPIPVKGNIINCEGKGCTGMYRQHITTKM
jgi:hypothetical protein